MRRGPPTWLLAAGAALAGVVLAARRPLRPEEPDDPVPAPREPLDPYANYEPPTNCDPTEKPGARALRDFVLGRFGGTDLGIIRQCDNKPDEHEEGRAWDWGIADPAHPADVAGFLRWLLASDTHGRPHAQARRLGVMYVIYNRQMWRSYDRPGQPRGAWYPYAGPDPHNTHIHISLSRAGAAGSTSFHRSDAQDGASA